jgi:RHS repeat-associated protein
MTTATLPSGTGIVSSYSYDNADRLTGISHVQNGSTTVASVSYTLDNVGNRTQRVDQQGTHSYSYDNLYRLTSVTYPGPSTTSYAFDAFGNRTSLTDGSGTTNYAYDDADRITSVTPPSPAPAINYTWDNNGNLTTRGSDTFSWDYEDRMTSATVSGVTSSVAYRGDGLRNSRTIGGVTVTFTWDVAAGLPVVLDDGNQYVYGAGLTAMKQSGSWYYYLPDGLGSTMAIVDGSGTVQKNYTYDVYGKPTATGTLPNEFDFAGQQTDPTGLQYLRARYMDPATGTFLSRDPVAASPGWRQLSHGYGGANPVRWSDASGLYWGESKVNAAKDGAKAAAGAAAQGAKAVATSKVFRQAVGGCAVNGLTGAAIAAGTGVGALGAGIAGCAAGAGTVLWNENGPQDPAWQLAGKCAIGGVGGALGGGSGTRGCVRGFLNGLDSMFGPDDWASRCAIGAVTRAVGTTDSGFRATAGCLGGALADIISDDNWNPITTAFAPDLGEGLLNEKGNH